MFVTPIRRYYELLRSFDRIDSSAPTIFESDKKILEIKQVLELSGFDEKETFISVSFGFEKGGIEWIEEHASKVTGICYVGRRLYIKDKRSLAHFRMMCPFQFIILED